MLLLQSGVRGAGFEFAHSDHLGYISASPSNLGTCLKANVMMRIPKFGDHPDFQSTLVRCPRRGWSHLRAMAPWNQPRLPHSTVPEVGQHVPGLQGQPRPRNPRRHLQRCVDTSLLKHPC